MNAHDSNNLLFLLNLTPQALKEWFYHASEDDIKYAEELIAEAHLIAIDARVAQMPQYTEAQKVLDKFTI